MRKPKVELTAEAVRKAIEENRPTSMTKLAHWLGYKGSVSSSLTAKFRALLPDIDVLLQRTAESVRGGGDKAPASVRTPKCGRAAKPAANHPVSCFIATEAGAIIGFACHDSTCRDFFGPTGVAEKRRGSGIGKALLLSCLHAMAAQGYAYAIIGGAGSTAFYTTAVGAVPIEGSSPGVYRDQLGKRNANRVPVTD